VSDDVANLSLLAYIAGHVIGCHLTQETRVQSASGDVANNIIQTLH